MSSNQNRMINPSLDQSLDPGLHLSLGHISVSVISQSRPQLKFQIK